LQGAKSPLLLGTDAAVINVNGQSATDASVQIDIFEVGVEVGAEECLRVDSDMRGEDGHLEQGKEGD
jgi:hypothetical protein